MSLEGIGGRLRADVCIVGAGAAGLTVAHALRDADVSVIVVESGPVSDPTILDAGEVVGHPYNGLLQGRVRGLGGTTAVWPGQCMRLRPVDLAAWPIGTEEMDRYYRRAEELLGIPAGETARDPWELLHEQGPGFDPSKVEFATAVFCRRPRLADLAVGGATILFGSVATALATGRVEVKDLAGRSVEIEADAIVLAAGTIETLRLLLVSGLGGGSAGVGFEDHGVCEPARVIGTARPLQDMYGLRLRRGLRYYPKLLLAPEKRGPDSPGCMANIVFHHSPTSAFESALRVRRSLRSRARPSASDVGRVVRGLPELVAAGMRVARGREPAPTPSEIRVLAIVEQRESETSRLTLADDVDALGIPQARIEWKLGNAERTSVETLMQVLDEEMRRTGAGSLAVEPWLSDDAAWFERVFDSFHPAGGARIGEVLDTDSRVCDTRGVYVCSAAAFPRTGCVNPTLTISALALRLADHLRGR